MRLERAVLDLPPQYVVERVILQTTATLMAQLSDSHLGALCTVRQARYLADSLADHNEVIGQTAILKFLQHPNLVRVIDIIYSPYKCSYCVVLDRVSTTLTDLVQRSLAMGRPLPEEEVWRLTAQMVSGLIYLHSSWTKKYVDSNGETVIIGRIPHRGIHPDSIYILADGTAVLSDFHLPMTPQDIISLNTLDEIAYMAPEMLTGGGMFSLKSDLWSLGCVMYFMCTGTPCFTGETIAELKQRIVNGICVGLDKTHANYSEVLISAIHKLLSVNPLQRPTAVELSEHPHIANCDVIFSEDASNTGIHSNLRTLPTPNNAHQPLVVNIAKMDKNSEIVVQPVRYKRDLGFSSAELGTQPEEVSPLRRVPHKVSEEGQISAVIELSEESFEHPTVNDESTTIEPSLLLKQPPGPDSDRRASPPTVGEHRNTYTYDNTRQSPMSHEASLAARLDAGIPRLSVTMGMTGIVPAAPQNIDTYLYDESEKNVEQTWEVPIVSVTEHVPDDDTETPGKQIEVDDANTSQWTMEEPTRDKTLSMDSSCLGGGDPSQLITRQGNDSFAEAAPLESMGQSLEPSLAMSHPLSDYPNPSMDSSLKPLSVENPNNLQQEHELPAEEHLPLSTIAASDYFSPRPISKDDTCLNEASWTQPQGSIISGLPRPSSRMRSKGPSFQVQVERVMAERRQGDTSAMISTLPKTPRSDSSALPSISPFMATTTPSFFNTSRATLDRVPPSSDSQAIFVEKPYVVPGRQKTITDESIESEQHPSYTARMPRPPKSNFRGKTSLMKAAIAGDLETALASIHEARLQDITGMTALMLAIMHRHRAVAEILINAELNIQDGSGWTALMWAVHMGDMYSVQMLLPEAGKRDIYGRTALMLAASHGYSDLVAVLADCEGGLQRRDGWTALMAASFHSLVEVDYILADREIGLPGKIPNTICLSQHGNTDAYLECVRILAPKETGLTTTRLFQWGSGFTALMAAALANFGGACRLLFDQEGKIFQSDGKGAEDYAEEYASNGALAALHEAIEQQSRYRGETRPRM
ncbi:Kinase, NEK [Giardia muris]|uniref:Kinase, NEK n=1 Tax=Giardia muris TaxID=5742 RepID=A0A4Z1T7V4_GIAMU|nr:Kinase, NEK [Giardia muris]|eukprot:TNJ28659.1 Kinase, NEK [Giardia muris]